MTMISCSTTKQQFLVTWYHPIERSTVRSEDSWVISRNDDFGYEVTRTVVSGENENEAKEAVRSRYQDPAVNLVFRSCTRYPTIETFLQTPRRGRWTDGTDAFRLHLLTA